jgi:Ca2+-binding EF-hand superfamily protein
VEPAFHARDSADIFQAVPAGYKPSPLGCGSPRASPFRRPEPESPVACLRQSTPPSSASKTGSLRTPSRFADEDDEGDVTPTRSSPDAARARAPNHNKMSSPRLGSPVSLRAQPPQSMGGGNALSQLQPAQVRVLRDGFQILDRDSDGVVNREDVADMMNQLGMFGPSRSTQVINQARVGSPDPAGMSSSPSEISQFFPPGGPQTMTLAVFLNSIAATLAAMSPSAELLSAFSAFDDDDSGQVDLAELRDALLNTPPEPGEMVLTPGEMEKVMAGFSGRRAFSKSAMAGNVAGGRGKRGEVFKYQDFVNSVVGGNGTSEPASTNGSGESEE